MNYFKIEGYENIKFTINLNASFEENNKIKQKKSGGDSPTNNLKKDHSQKNSNSKFKNERVDKRVQNNGRAHLKGVGKKENYSPSLSERQARRIFIQQDVNSQVNKSNSAKIEPPYIREGCKSPLSNGEVVSSFETSYFSALKAQIIKDLNLNDILKVLEDRGELK